MADENYIRESIINPQAKVVAGYQPLMPTFQGLISEEELLQLIAYIRRSAAAPRANGAAHRSSRPDQSGGHDAATGRPNYLNADHGAQVVAPDDRPQADRAPVPRARSRSSSRSAGSSRRSIRLELLTPAGRPAVEAETYNKLFTHARRRHGLLLPDPVDPGGARELPHADHDRRARTSPSRKLNLLSWYIYMFGGAFTLCGDDHRRRRHGLDVLHAVQHDVSNTHVIATALGIFITGFSSILTGLNFIVTIHTHARAGHDLVPHAALRLGALRDQPDHDPRHAGPRDHAAARRGRARSSASASSTRRSAAIRCSSSTSSGSTRTRPSTS